MFTKIEVVSLEVAMGRDIVALQNLLNTGLAEFLGTMVSTYGAGPQTGVVTGMAVSLVGASYQITPGWAIQRRATPVEPGDSLNEIIGFPTNATVPAQPPVAGATYRMDMLEIRSKARTATNEERPFYDPATGGTYPQNTPKIIRSLPELRIRIGITGATFDPDWIPLALIEVTGTPTSPAYALTDVRPLLHGMSTQPDGCAELSCPAGGSVGLAGIQISPSGVRLDGERFLSGGGASLFSDLREGTNPVFPAADTLFHLYAARPSGLPYSPSVLQLILTLTPPTQNGRPSVPLTMRAPFTGSTTQNALYLGGIPITVGSSGSPPVNTFTGIGLRRVGPMSLVGPSTLYRAQGNSVMGTNTATIAVPGLPPSAGIARVSVRINLIDTPDVVEVGSNLQTGSAVAQIARVPIQNFLAVASPPPSVVYGPPVMLDVVVMHNNGSPTIQLQFDQAAHYQCTILGWIDTPDGSYVTAG